MREQTGAAFGEGENPGNAVYEQAPAVQQVLAHPQVVGELSCIIGPDYYMECHRHAHLTKPGQQAGGFHQDGTLRALECRVTGGEGIMAIVNFACLHRAGANTSDRERIMLKFLFDRRSEPQAPSWDAVDRYDPGFDAKAQEWSGLDDGRLLCLPRSWQTMWNWLGDRGEECLASVSSTDELMAALGSAEEAVALEAAASALLNRLRVGEEMEREMVALALSAAGSAAVPALRQALSDDDAWLRAMAVDLAGDSGRESLALLPEIGEGLDDEDAWV